MTNPSKSCFPICNLVLSHDQMVANYGPLQQWRRSIERASRIMGRVRQVMKGRSIR